MNRIKQNCVIPCAALTVPRSKIRYYQPLDKAPEMGDLIYGEVFSIGQHKTLESKSARKHTLHDRTRAIFVMGNRYAPDYYEAFVPEQYQTTVDLVARGGIVANVAYKNGTISDPTKINVLGYACDKEGNVLNTRSGNLLAVKEGSAKSSNNTKIILCVGTSMNSGKSYAAAACCYAISSMGQKVKAAKITGTACLKDILLMEDCGAESVADFTYLGYPSTYMLNADELWNIFNQIDCKFAVKPANYLVFELADGILQRETAMLLKMPEVRQRIHKLIFSAQDAFGALGGITQLKEQFDLTPDAISGVCSSSPLTVRELRQYTDIPILYSFERKFKTIFGLIE